MLNYDEIKERKIIILEDEPMEVVSSHVFRKQQRKPVNITKLKSLLSGKVVEHTFHQADRVPEADISRREVTFLFQNPKKNEYMFLVDEERMSLPASAVGDKIKYLKENDEAIALFYTNDDDEEICISLDIPIKVDLKITETQPNIKGNSAVAGTKPAVTETGLVVNVPLFLNAGDTIRINTLTGEYVERAEKG